MERNDSVPLLYDPETVEVRREPHPTIKELMERVHSGVEKVNLGPIAGCVREGRKVSPTTPEKAELHAIAAVVIDALWKDIDEWIAQNQPGLSTPPVEFGINPKPVTIAEVFEKNTFSSPQSMGSTFSQHTLSTLRHFVMRWFSKMSLRQDLSDREKNPLDQAFARYKLLNRRRMEGTYSRSPEDNIISGMHTANRVTWKILSLIQPAFTQAYKRPLPHEELYGIARRCEGLIQALAGAHIDIISDIEEKISASKKPYQSHIFYKQGHFNFVERAEGLCFELRPEFFEGLIVVTPEVRTGCPALVSGNVRKVFLWIENIFEEMYKHPHILNDFNQKLLSKT